jgi:hypothetical protein
MLDRAADAASTAPKDQGSGTTPIVSRMLA